MACFNARRKINKFALSIASLIGITTTEVGADCSAVATAALSKLGRSSASAVTTVRHNRISKGIERMIIPKKLKRIYVNCKLSARCPQVDSWSYLAPKMNTFLRKVFLIFYCAPVSRTPNMQTADTVEWWNWQTRMIKGHVPRGVGVQVPLRPPAPFIRAFICCKRRGLTTGIAVIKLKV